MRENVVSVHTPLDTIYSVLIEWLGTRNQQMKKKNRPNGERSRARGHFYTLIRNET